MLYMRAEVNDTDESENTHKETTYGQIRNERNGRRYNQRG